MKRRISILKPAVMFIIR